MIESADTVPVRELEQQDDRVETGVIRFGDDWPGVFIRGDDCYRYLNALRHVTTEEMTDSIGDEIAVICVRGLIDLLDSSNVKNHGN